MTYISTTGKSGAFEGTSADLREFAKREFGAHTIMVGTGGWQCYADDRLPVVTFQPVPDDFTRTMRKVRSAVGRGCSARGVIIGILQEGDPNGSHTDELAIADGIDPYALAGAYAALRAYFSEA
jgi:hypothetical protein